MYLCIFPGNFTKKRGEQNQKNMKLSLRWLSQYLNLEYSPEEIADMLTTIGLEVEGWERKEMIKGGLQGVVVGHVLSCEKHPDADKLSLTKVDVGSDESIQIVCGAPNVATGQKVLVATIGTTLYDKDAQPWKIKKGKIRGQESEGMICSASELGLSEDHSGIMILNDEAVVGTPAATFLNLPDDVVFEIGLTPNRSDATSHLGVARDLFAYCAVNKNYNQEIKWPDTSDFVTEKIMDNIDVVVENKNACPRYAGVTINHVQVGESPDWLKQLLLSVDIKPINNIVDITNYILHEYGQPLHAFDADKIEGQKIIVDTLPEGTDFVTLDGNKRTLKKNDLMINDGQKKPLCLAGVYGGLGSGVTTETKRVFLESAYFNPGFVRGTSMGHNLRTDAAKVFEKGADPNMVLPALKRAAGLIRKLAGGAISNLLIDVYPKPLDRADILLRYEKVNEVIGISINKDKIHHILVSMGMKIKPMDEYSILVNPGSNKHDVTREIDLIEEILRIYGLNNVPLQSGIKSTISYTEKPNKKEILENIAQFLSSNLYLEMMGLSLVESKNFSEKTGFDPKNFVYINNTSNVHLNIMRPDMLTSGLLSVAYNLNRQQNQIKLFEHGKTYIKSEDQYQEKEYVSIFLSGNIREESWFGDTRRDAGFFDIKHTVQSIFQRLGIQEFTVEETKAGTGLAYGLAYVKGEKTLARFGLVAPSFLKQQGIKQPVFYGELDIAHLVKACSKSKTLVKEISKFPSSRRDLAVIVDDTTTFASIRDTAAKCDKKWLRDIRLFDIFKDENKVGAGKKSYAISFHFENEEKTLSDKEVEQVMQKIILALENQSGALIRK